MSALHSFRDWSPPDLRHDLDEDEIDATRMPSIVKPHRVETIMALAVLSGLLSTATVWSMHEIGLWLGPGVLFGVLVLLPWCRVCQVRWWDTGAVLGLAPLGYAAAVYLTLNFNGFTLFAGLAGGAITFLPILVNQERRIRSAAILALGIGWILGIVLAAPCVAYLGGIAVWQVAVAYCLTSALSLGDDVP